jgi:hypothetical protein
LFDGAGAAGFCELAAAPEDDPEFDEELDEGVEPPLLD